MSNRDYDDLHAQRHSLAHVLAAAIQKLWPKTRFGVGPVVEDGFYYDVDPGVTISEDDLPKIEKEMRKIIKANHPFEQYDLEIDEAIKWAKDSGQDFKAELLSDLKTKGTTAVADTGDAQLLAPGHEPTSASFYKSGDFTDLCRGPHVESTGKVGAFKLHKVAGAYWRGDETKPQLQRIYGWAFADQKALDAHIKMMAAAKERDHRRLGKELDLFTFSDLVGSGLPLFTPRGTLLRDKLGALSQQVREQRGFSRVTVPHITKTVLYEKSGHWDKFGDELFLVASQETSDKFALKPMNCPHHTQLYAARPRSYRDLPLKYMETTMIYRDEKSGELHGLERVRAATQDDSHVFCTQDQVEGIVAELVEAAQQLYQEIGMPLQRIRLSFRDDGDAYLGDKDLWARAQSSLETIAKQNHLDYFVEEGEAAFYGPKIDFMASDAIGRTTQVATVQLDFVQPARFGLEYNDENDTVQQPVMVHCALLGSLERFLSVYIEHIAGHFPFWLAPEQVRVLTINDTVLDYADEIKKVLDSVVLMQPLKYNELRYLVDDRNESLGKKIREASTQKVPLQLIIGPRDKEAQTVSVRRQDGEETIKLADLGGLLQKI